jgi:hypothetical protein
MTSPVVALTGSGGLIAPSGQHDASGSVTLGASGAISAAGGRDVAAELVALQSAGDVVGRGAPGTIIAFNNPAFLTVTATVSARSGTVGLNSRSGTATLTGSGTLWPIRPLPDFADDVADAELLAVTLIASNLNVRVVTELPFDITNIVPVVQITEAPGGQQQQPGIDTAVIDYDAYDNDRTRAKLLAAAVRSCLLTASGYTVPSGTPWLTWINEVRRPTLLPYDDASDIRRYGGAMRLHLHSLTAP